MAIRPTPDHESSQILSAHSARSCDGRARRAKPSAATRSPLRRSVMGRYCFPTVMTTQGVASLNVCRSTISFQEKVTGA